jgi:hypothetical protein
MPTQAIRLPSGLNRIGGKVIGGWTRLIAMKLARMPGWVTPSFTSW